MLYNGDGMGAFDREFRRALGQFASGVTVVTTIDAAGQPQGLTASSFCSVSLAPPLVLVCVDNRISARRAIEESRFFTVSVLAETQEAVSRRFASGAADKFAGPGLVPGTNGAVLVSGALAHMECRLAAAHLAGDHTIFVGEVVRLAAAPGRPLLYHESGYHRLEASDPSPVAGAPVRDRV
jgi:flavin reductase (DIM6/NTAB) family NADH-FMN oxidoreductase RutF